MSPEEFFRGLVKGADSQLRQSLKKEVQDLFHLGKLYLIYINCHEAVWGLRQGDYSILPSIQHTLQLFVRKQIGIDYPPYRFRIFDRPHAEVGYLLSRHIITLLQKSGGSLRIVSADEETGMVIIELKGCCLNSSSFAENLEYGIRQLLIHLLPWVREVKTEISVAA